MSKRLLFIEDLYDFYSNTYKRSTRFDAEKTGSPIVVQVHGKVNFKRSDKDTEGLLPVHLQSCHTNLNVNGSNITDEVMFAALPSFSNRPILGYIHSVEGEWQFYSHNMHEGENGETVYDEVPVGIVPESCNARLVYDIDKKKTYCEVDGYVFEEYSKAAEILQREGECPVSVELSIRSLSYNAKEKYLDIEDFFFSGVTILGKTPEGVAIIPGMEKANIKLADFSTENNSLFANNDKKISELQERLKILESACFNTKFKEGGNKGNMNKFGELLAKYDKSSEEITFEHNELSEEELEAKFEETFGTCNDGNNELDGVLASNEEFEKIIRTYEISHEDVRYALYQLLSDYESADNDWYFINSVYDTYFTYENWNGDKIYGQVYEKDGDNIAFSGERYSLHRELLTDSEYAELQSMRSNYAALKEFKENTEKNELHAQRMELINSEKYSILAKKNAAGEYLNANFAALVESMDNYSLAELETHIKVLHSDYMSEHSSFEAKPKNKNTGNVKIFANLNGKAKPKRRYGDLFSNEY